MYVYVYIQREKQREMERDCLDCCVYKIIQKVYSINIFTHFFSQAECDTRSILRGV